MKFSVILPVRLEKYRHQGKDPESKLVRAVQSVLAQDDFELVIISDGCDMAVNMIRDNYSDPRIKLFKIPERKISKNKRNAGAAGLPRNAGIQQASGEYIIYLDHDDVYEDGYLETLKKEMTDHDWYWFDNLSWNEKHNRSDVFSADIDRKGFCGTANICHRRDLGAFWSPNVHYLHDWWFINTLKATSDNYKRLETAGYCVMHVPHLLDV